MTAARRRTKPQTIAAWQRGRFTYAVRGPARVIHPTLQRLGMPWQWDHNASAYLVSAQRVDDLLCALEVDGHHVDVGMAGW